MSVYHSDPAGSAVWRMETREFRGIWRRTRVPFRYRKRLVRMLCRLYAVPMLSVQSVTNPGYSGQFWHNAKMGICWLELHPSRGADLLTLAHEFAHYLTHLRSPRATDHGPTFLRHYMQVCESLRLIPSAGFRQACRRHGLTIASTKC